MLEKAMVAEFEFQGTLHRTFRAMHDAIAEEWLSAGGSNTPEAILQLLKQPDELLAAEAAEAFGLHGIASFNRRSLCDAFARIRNDLEKRFPTDAQD